MSFIQLQLRGFPITIYQAESEQEAASGLLGTLLQDDQGFMLPSINGLHTIGMSAPIDVIWLDEEGNTLSIDENVMPGQVIPAKGPFAVELMGGWFRRHPACSCPAPGACACNSSAFNAPEPAQFVGQNYMERPGPLGMRGPGPMSRGGRGHSVRGNWHPPDQRYGQTAFLPVGHTDENRYGQYHALNLDEPHGTVQFTGAPHGGGGHGGGGGGHAGPGTHPMGGGGGAPRAHGGPGAHPGIPGHHPPGHPNPHGHGTHHGHHHDHHNFGGGGWGGWGDPGWAWWAWPWSYECDPQDPNCPLYYDVAEDYPGALPNQHPDQSW